MNLQKDLEEQGKLEVNDEAGDKKEIDGVLADLLEYLGERSQHQIGYPYNQSINYEELQPFMQFCVNNLGDPFQESNYGVHLCAIERAVLRFFARLWRTNLDDAWGYVTSCGTEGNLLGILYGREKLGEPVLYTSREAHYSIWKAGSMFRIPVETVSSGFSGEMDYDDLERCLRKHPGRPALVCAALGTTVKGAYDSVDDILERLRAVGLTRDEFYIHVDGALNAMILPFIEQEDVRRKCVSFEKDVDSISVSGHKMLGCPMPCGVVLTRREHSARWSSEVEYLSSVDTTITGSRNGQAALAMWVALQRKGLHGFRQDVLRCVDNAAYLREQLDKSGISVLVNRFSTTVVFERPPEFVVKKWQLACVGGIAHAVVMPSITREKLDLLIADIISARKESNEKSLSVYEWIGPNCKVYQNSFGLEWVAP